MVLDPDFNIIYDVLRGQILTKYVDNRQNLIDFIKNLNLSRKIKLSLSEPKLLNPNLIQYICDPGWFTSTHLLIFHHNNKYLIAVYYQRFNMDFKGPTKLLQEDISEKWNLHIDKIMQFIDSPLRWQSDQKTINVLSSYCWKELGIYEQIVITTMLLRISEYIDLNQ